MAIANLNYMSIDLKQPNTGYVDFVADGTWSFAMSNTGPHYWNRIEYLDSNGSWVNWDGYSDIAAHTIDDSLYHVRLRGVGNTSMTCSSSSTSSRNYFSCKNLSSSCSVRIFGNAENLMDYTVVASGGHPTMAVNCWQNAFSYWTHLVYVDRDFLTFPTISNYGCSNMFQSCSNLIYGPEIQATTIGDYGCQYAFSSCSKIRRCITKINATTVGKNAFYYLFIANLTDTCELEVCPSTLPAVSMSNYCYAYMFAGCKNITTPPALPATTLANYCYSYMFYGCTSLTTVPALPATTMAQNCYNGMFNGCTSLTSIPEIYLWHVTTLSTGCFRSMFQSCTSFTGPIAIARATTTAEGCYYQMYRGCSSLNDDLSRYSGLPAVGKNMYFRMFYDCKALPSALKFAVNVGGYEGCCQEMYYGCTNLETVPALYCSGTLGKQCFYQMFRGCTKIKLSTSQTGEYTNRYRIPYVESTSATSGTDSVKDMFYQTGGTFTGTPSLNTNYYTSNTVLHQ